MGADEFGREVGEPCPFCGETWPCTSWRAAPDPAEGGECRHGFYKCDPGRPAGCDCWDG